LKIFYWSIQSPLSKGKKKRRGEKKRRGKRDEVVEDGMGDGFVGDEDASGAVRLEHPREPSTVVVLSEREVASHESGRLRCASHGGE